MSEPGVELTLRDLDRRDRRHGYSMVGYHYVIRRDGRIETGRSEDVPSIHDDLKRAKDSIAVCLVGGADERGGPANNFTPEQWSALCLLFREIGRRHEGIKHRSATPSVTTDHIIARYSKWLSQH